MRVLLQHSVAGTGLSKTRELSPTAVLPSVLACFDPRLSRGFLSRRLSHTRVFLQERTRRVISFHDTFFRPNKRGRKLSSRLSLSLSLSLSVSSPCCSTRWKESMCAEVVKGGGCRCATVAAEDFLFQSGCLERCSLVLSPGYFREVTRYDVCVFTFASSLG